MKRLTAILVLLTALSIGWVPVFAAPGRLAEGIARTSPASAHVQHSDGCGSEQHHCTEGAKQQHPAMCAACIGVPAVVVPIVLAEQPKVIIPRGEELPLIAGADAPLPRPPRM